MCVPAVGAAIQGIGLTLGAINTINDYNKTSATAKYQTQAALVNMKAARDLAYEQRQQGIEAAKKEKINGIQKASLLMANNAAGGFDVNSGINFFNQNDALEEGYLNAENTRNKYNSQANNYFRQANDYLNQANQANSETKNKLFSLALTGLGSTTSVAKRWYKTGSIF